MNSIVILCGGVRSGKTTTMQNFFGDGSIDGFVSRKLDGKIVCAVGDSSIQERLVKKDFCKVDKVQEDIKSQVKTCDRETKGEPYILIMPFTMRTLNNERDSLNENCIIKPIKYLKKSFKVFVIYMRKTNTKLLSEKDDLIKRIIPHVDKVKTIETTEEDCDKSKELEIFLKKHVI